MICVSEMWRSRLSLCRLDRERSNLVVSSCMYQVSNYATYEL